MPEMEELIRGIWLLYLCISSKHRINSKRFAILCKKTKKEYFKIFKNPEDRRSWKLVIPTAHQIWDHPELMDELPAASGLLTEHGSEGNNKFIKMTYQYLTRKCSRQKKMEDFFCRLLKKSDMKFQSYLIPRYLKNRPAEAYPPEVIACFEDPSVVIGRTTAAADNGNTSDEGDDDDPNFVDPDPMDESSDEEVFNDDDMDEVSVTNERGTGSEDESEPVETDGDNDPNEIRLRSKYANFWAELSSDEEPMEGVETTDSMEID